MCLTILIRFLVFVLLYVEDGVLNKMEKKIIKVARFLL